MMKKTLLTLILSMTACLSVYAQFERVPAFPGAEGHGRFVAGGRGGKVVHVTNLNDSGAGSFRQAVSGSDKKIVVFDVGGVIALKSDLTIGANTTVLGQTAPSPGITLRYYTIQPSGNCIIRYIRSRRGQEKDINDGADAIWQRHVTGVIIDHCSFSWSIDEVASFYDNNNFTMQWCTIAESLVNPGHSKGAHGYGGIWGGKLASFHHNLIAHVANRSPRFNGARYNWTGYTSNQLYAEYQWENAVQAENVDFRNCVVYNCGNGCYGGPGGGQVNIVNNYYKTGPADNTTRVTNVSIANSTSAKGYDWCFDMTSRYYINGNQVNSYTNRDWTGIAYDSGVLTLNGERYSKDPNHYHGENVTYTKVNGVDCVRIKMDSPAPVGYVTTHKADEAYEKVLDYAGASLSRDDVDQRYAEETRSGTATYKGSVTGKAGRIDVVADVDGYTESNFGTGKWPVGYDSDGDGIPNTWETANGLNPNDASDALLYTLDTKGWYSNIEVYANSLVEEITQLSRDDADSSFDEYYPTYKDVDGTIYNAGSADRKYDGEPGTSSEGYVAVASGEITWTLASGSNSETGVVSTDIADYFSAATMTTGSDLTASKKTYSGIDFTSFTSASAKTSAATDNAVTFTASTANGSLFLPSKVKFLALRDGTDHVKLDAAFQNAAFKQGLASNISPTRSNAYSTLEYDLTSKPSDGAQTLTVNLYDIPSGKRAALAQVVIVGDIVRVDETGIGLLAHDNGVAKVSYLDLTGRPTTNSGIVLEVTDWTNGSRTVRKVMRQ